MKTAAGAPVEPDDCVEAGYTFLIWPTDPPYELDELEQLLVWRDGR